VSLGDFAVTPGLRYDHTSINGDFVSPSIGLTYTPLERTSLRAYVARGFNTPPLFSTFGDGVFFVANPGLKMEEVWSYSLGVETTFLKHFWFKSTGFLHHISDVITTTKLPNNTFTAVNSGKQRRQGVEAEVRTLPVYNTSLMAGFAFVDARDRETGREIPDVPRYTWDVGIDYNDNTSFRGALRGHYIWWNAEAANNARYKAFIWDVNLAKSIFDREGAALEIFFTAHNIFNGSQYFVGIFPNPRRWFEGGVRYKF